MSDDSSPLLPDDERASVNEALVEKALLLIARVHHGTPNSARAAQRELDKWPSLSPMHQQALETARAIWAGTDASGLRDAIAKPASAEEKRLTRRHVNQLLSVIGLVFAGGGSHKLWQLHQQQPIYEASLQTQRHQLLDRSLPDGSTVRLAANTALTVRQYRNRRTIALAHGQAEFSVSADAKRPFLVATPHSLVQVLGTTFTISAQSQHSEVAVSQGRVAVWPPTPALAQALASGDTPTIHPPDAAHAPAAILTTGQWLQIDAQQHIEQGTLDPSQAASWRDGWLFFRNTPLTDAVARWNDYLRTPILLDNPAALARLRITGGYPLQHPNAFIDALPGMLPVTVRYGARAQVTIAPR